MDFLKYPLPIINILNELDNWSLRQSIPFSRKEITNGGFSWASEYNEHFHFSIRFQLNSPADSKTYSLSVLANPMDLISYNSKLVKNFFTLNQPYTIDSIQRIIMPLNQEYNDWMGRILEYEKTTLFGEVNFQNYEKEFYDQFEIIEEDADTSPFDHSRQILIEKAVDRVISDLEKYKNEHNKLEIQEAITFAQEVKSHIPKNTKNQLMIKLAQLFAKVRITGATLSMEVLKHFTVELVKYIGSSL